MQTEFFTQPLSVINVGLAGMADSVRAQGVPVTDVDWRPPAVPHLRQTPDGAEIDAAYAVVCQRIQRGRPVLKGMGIL